MPGAKKRMGMVQLGLLGVGALLLGGALVVKEKREAMAASGIEMIASQSPAAGDSTVPPRAFGNQPIPGSATAVEGVPGAVEGSPGQEGISVEEAERLGVPLEDNVEPPVMAEPDCSAFEEWVGKPVDEAAVKATGRPFRILKPGMAVTMDFSPDRINVETDEKGEIVVRVYCG